MAVLGLVGNCTMGPGLEPTHTVLVATSEAVLMTLIDPVLAHIVLLPEFVTYMVVVIVEARAIGREPGYNETLITLIVPNRLNWLTESASRLAMKIAPFSPP